MMQETCHDATVHCCAPGSAYGCILTTGHDGAHQNREGVTYTATCDMRNP